LAGHSQKAYGVDASLKPLSATWHRFQVSCCHFTTLLSFGIKRHLSNTGNAEARTRVFPDGAWNAVRPVRKNAGFHREYLRSSSFVFVKRAANAKDAAIDAILYSFSPNIACHQRHVKASVHWHTVAQPLNCMLFEVSYFLLFLQSTQLRQPIFLCFFTYKRPASSRRTSNCRRPCACQRPPVPAFHSTQFSRLGLSRHPPVRDRHAGDVWFTIRQARYFGECRLPSSDVVAWASPRATIFIENVLSKIGVTLDLETVSRINKLLSPS